MRMKLREIVFMLAIAAVPVAAMAGDLPAPAATASAPSPIDGWLSQSYTVTVGAELRWMPRWVGADTYAPMPVPLFDIRRAGTPEKYCNARDGIGVGLFEFGTLTIGPVMQLEFARRVKSDPALTGTGDVKLGVLVGAFFEYWPVPWLRLRTETKEGIHGHHGFVADEIIDFVVPIDRWTLSAGPRTTWADARANGRYFDINAIQSAASGLPQWQAKAGTRSAGLGAQARYRLDQQWSSHVFVEYDRLIGDAADSPLVQQRGDPNQYTFGAGITYTFDIGR